MKRECYSCVRRNECYTNSGIEKLEPGKLFDCGALYTTTEEADATHDGIYYVSAPNITFKYTRDQVLIK